MIINGFENVLLDDESDYEFEQLNESHSLKKTFASMSQLMKDKFDDYLFFILASDNPKIKPASLDYVSKKKKVLISISDESGAVPDYLSPYYYAVFKTYLKEDSFFFNNIFNFPLSCVKDVPQLPILPVKIRKYSVFFSGHLNNQRVNFYFSLLFPLLTKISNFSIRSSVVRKLMLPLKSNFDDRFSNALIRFTSGFKKGISPTTYGQIIADSKIVLCPSGSYSAECFRHYEAMRSGCIIISEKLPDTYFYKDSPIIQVEDWSEGLRMVSELLDDPSQIERLAHLTQKWWAERCSEEASARFVSKSLNLIEDNDMP